MDKTSTRTQWQHFYWSSSWLRRRKLQLKHEPLCRMCLAKGLVTPARVADHIEPHNGDWTKFRLGGLQSLCFDCHGQNQAADRAARLLQRDRRRRLADRSEASGEQEGTMRWLLPLFVLGCSS